MIHTMRRLAVLAFGSLLVSPMLHAEEKHHWTYSGDTGPPTGPRCSPSTPCAVLASCSRPSISATA